MAHLGGYCSLMAQSVSTSDTRCSRCFRSLRARLALDGVIWGQGGLVETAVSRGFDCTLSAGSIHRESLSLLKSPLAPDDVLDPCRRRSWKAPASVLLGEPRLRSFPQRFPAGICCVMQWMLPPPSSTSCEFTPAISWPGKISWNCRWACPSVFGSSTGMMMRLLVMRKLM